MNKVSCFSWSSGIGGCSFLVFQHYGTFGVQGQYGSFGVIAMNWRIVVYGQSKDMAIWSEISESTTMTSFQRTVQTWTVLQCSFQVPILMGKRKSNPSTSLPSRLRLHHCYDDGTKGFLSDERAPRGPSLFKLIHLILAEGDCLEFDRIDWSHPNASIADG